MDMNFEIEQQAFQDDVRLGVKNPGMKCATPSPAELSLQKRIAGILESIKVSVQGYYQDEFGAPEGGWHTPVMEKVREIVGR